MPKDRQDARRAMPQILALIQAVALLHQHQRSDPALAHGDQIDPTIFDYVIARRLLVSPLSRSLGGGLPPAVSTFGERLLRQFGQEVFSSTDALTSDGVLGNKSKVNEYLRSLCEAGIAECVHASKGPQPAQWRIVCPIPVGSALWLPTVHMLEGYK